MTGLVKTGVLTATTQTVSIASQMAPTTVTLNTTALLGAIRLSYSRSGDVATFAVPAAMITATGAISCAVLSPCCWVEFTGDIGDTYEIV